MMAISRIVVIVMIIVVPMPVIAIVKTRGSGPVLQATGDRLGRFFDKQVVDKLRPPNDLK